MGHGGTVLKWLMIEVLYCAKEPTSQYLLLVVQLWPASGQVPGQGSKRYHGSGVLFDLNARATATVTGSHSLPIRDCP